MLKISKMLYTFGILIQLVRLKTIQNKSAIKIEIKTTL